MVTRSVVRRPPSCETPSLKVGAVSQLVSSPSHGMKEAALEGRTMSPANVTFCQVRVRAVRWKLSLPMSVSASTMTPGGGKGGGGEGGGGEGGGAGGGEGGWSANGHSTVILHARSYNTVPSRPHHGHSTVTARSQHGHSTVIARPQHGHSTATALSQHGRSTVAARSQQGRSRVAARPHHGHSTHLPARPASVPGRREPDRVGP